MATLTLEKYNTDFYLKSILDKIYPIGKPFTTLSNVLNDNEIWLEGAEVSKTTYSALYEVYGDTYGTPENEDNFILPDFRDRVIQGGDDFGYIEAGLPNITGYAGPVQGRTSSVTYTFTGAFADSVKYGTETLMPGSSNFSPFYLDFNASNSNSTYGNSDTVQPPAITARVKTRYK